MLLMKTITIHDILSYKTSQLIDAKLSCPESQLIDDVQNQNSTLNSRPFKTPFVINSFSIIAEIKRRSPGQGLIRENLNLQEVSRIYEQFSQISCISVLTDDRFFGGTLIDLQSVRKLTTKPLLRKDFIIDTYQIYEAKLWGADAILLIAAILTTDKISAFSQLAKSLGLETLVECHNEEDLNKIPFQEIELIGINSRDLMGDMHIDLSVFEKLIVKIPPNKLVIAESGIKSEADLRLVKELGYKGALIGAGILKKPNLCQGIHDLLQI